MSATPLSRACADAVLDVLPSAMDAIRHGMRSQLAGGLSVPQFRCLNFTDRCPGCSLGEVAAFLGVTLPTASAMVDRLVRAGHLQSAPAAEDRRRTRLHISNAGKALLEQVRTDTRSELAATLARRPTDELRAISAGLAALKRAFSRRTEPCCALPCWHWPRVVSRAAATGTVEPLSSIDVKPQVSSVVTRVHVKEGQFVRAGEWLFTLNARTDEANLAKAQAQLARDQATLADARRQLERSRDLLARNFVAPSAVDTAQSNVDAQQAALQADQAAIDAVKVSLSYSRM